MAKVGRPKKSSTKKKRTGENVFVGKYEHIFNKRWTENEIKSLADELIDWVEEKPENLWINDFFNAKKLTRARVSDTFMKIEYFAKIYNICKSIQESRMFKAGTNRKFNPAMFIIGLKNNHGWSDKQDISMENKTDLTIKNIDLSKFTEYGLERLKRGDEIESVLLDPKSIKHTQ